MDEKTKKIPLKETKKIRAALEEKTIEGLTGREWEYWKRDQDWRRAETARRDDGTLVHRRV